ncbi:YeeE/YedE thiosulfate transporter family protein [Geodermatophilus sp. YIM 151500]|uniref:YeeE/YedE thiosulfate transporter family protein n=1 Tax=Geodermatophilus sp. YIM 151500 TaxID=2984531 RepID=UPI00398CCED8
MLGALVGLAGWGAGELVARQVPRPGPVALAGGEAATVPALLGLPRPLVAALFLARVVGVLLARRGAGRERRPGRQWGWAVTGPALGAVTVGGWAAARTAGGWWLRGETRVRYGQLALGGALLGAGGRIAGGCNLGHGLSGVAQLNVSSWVVVAAIAVGIGSTRVVQRRCGDRPAARTPVP